MLVTNSARIRTKHFSTKRNNRSRWTRGHVKSCMCGTWFTIRFTTCIFEALLDSMELPWRWFMTPSPGWDEWACRGWPAADTSTWWGVASTGFAMSLSWQERAERLPINSASDKYQSARSRCAISTLSYHTAKLHWWMKALFQIGFHAELSVDLSHSQCSKFHSGCSILLYLFVPLFCSQTT